MGPTLCYVCRSPIDGTVGHYRVEPVCRECARKLSGTLSNV